MKAPAWKTRMDKAFWRFVRERTAGQSVFDAQAAHIEPILEKEKTGLSVAFLQLHRMERLRYGNQMIMYHQ